MDPNSNTVQPQADPYYSSDTSGGFFSGKKKLIFIILGVLIVLGLIFFVLWAFIFNRNDNSNKEVTLTYWGVWEDAAVLQPIFDDFHRENPNIIIQYEKIDVKTLGDYVKRLQTRTEEGNGPDVMRFHSSWLTQIQGILLPFPEDVVSETGLSTDYFKTVERDLKRDGAYYGLPLSIDTLALYINKDLLNNVGAQVPTSWDELESTARELTTVDGGKIVSSGVAMGTYDNISHASDLIALLFLQNGAEIENITEDNMESAVSALQFYTRFSEGTDLAVWDQSMENSKVAFAGGKLAMYFGYSWDIFEINNFNPNLNFEVHPVPELFGTNSTIASYWAEGVSNKSKNPEEALKFIKFLGKNETLQKIYENQMKARGYGSPYPKKNLAELQKDNNKVYAFTQRADNAVSTYFASDTYDAGLNQEMNVYLGNAIRGILNDNISYSSAVETLGSGVRQVLEHYEGTN